MLTVEVTLDIKDYCRTRWFEGMSETPAATPRHKSRIPIRRKSVEDTFINSAFMRSTGEWRACLMDTAWWEKQLVYYNSPEWKNRVAVDNFCDKVGDQL
jgi:hypothetical protein